MSLLHVALGRPCSVDGDAVAAVLRLEYAAIDATCARLPLYPQLGPMAITMLTCD